LKAETNGMEREGGLILHTEVGKEAEKWITYSFMDIVWIDVSH
jgi:hypothetical protein